MKFINKDQTLRIAATVGILGHKGQKDKVGEDYFMHLQRVSFGCKSIDAKIVAWLHDIVEDGHTTMETLESLGFLSDKHLYAIKCLTKDPDSFDHDYYYRGISFNKIAKEVKIADLKDNMDLTRFKRAGKELTERDWNRYAEYKKRLDYLESR